MASSAPVPTTPAADAEARLDKLSESAWWAAAEAAWAKAQLERSSTDLALLEHQAFFRTQRERQRRCLARWHSFAGGRLHLLPAATALILTIPPADRRAKLSAVADGSHLIGLRPLSGAFEAWAGVARGQRSAARSAIVHALQRRERAALRGWREATASRVRQLGQLRRAIGHGVNRTLSLGWGSWAELMAEARMRAESAAKRARCVRLILHRRTGAGWRSWVGFRLDRLERMHTLRRGLARLVHREMHRALRTWEAEHAQICMLRRFASRLAQRALARACRTWRSHSFEGTRVMRLLSRAGSHVVHSDLARGWLGWYDSFLAVSATRRSLVRAASHLVRRGESRAFSGWRIHATELRYRKAALSHLVHASLSRGLRSWCEQALERSAFLAIVRAGIGRLVHRETSRGFGAWAQACGERRRRMASLNRSLRAFVHSGSVRGWRQWLAFAYHRAALADALGYWGLASVGKAWRTLLAGRTERYFALQLLRRGASHLVQRQLANGFTQWQFAFDDTSQYLAGPLRVAARFAASRGLSKAYLTWLDVSRKLIAFEGWVRRWAGRAFLRGWLGWRSAHAEAVACKRLLRRAVARMANRALARGWRAWDEHVESRHAFAQTASRAMRRMLRRSLARALLTWSGVHDPSGPMLRAATFFHDRTLGRAHRRWRGMAAEGARANRLQRKALGRLLSSQLARGFVSWEQMAMSRLERLRKLRRGVAAICHRRLLGAFVALSDHALASLRAAHALEAMSPEGRARRWAWALLREGGRLHQSMRVAASRFCMRDVMRALHGWAQVVGSLAGLRSLVLRIYIREAACGLAVWAEAAAAHRLVAKVFRHARSKGLGAGWRAWAAFAADAKASLGRVGQAARRWCHSALSSGLRAWQAEAEARGALMGTARTCFGRIGKRWLARGLNKWAVVTAKALALRRSIAGFVSPERARAFATWQALVSLRLAAAASRSRAFAYFRAGPGLGKAMRTWRGSALEVMRRIKIGRAVVHRLCHRALSRAFEAWEARSTTLEEEQRLLRKGASSFWTPESQRAFRHWSDLARLVHTTSRACRRLGNRRLSMGWHSWKAWRHELADEHRLQRRALSHVLHPELRRGLTSWLALTHAQRVLSGGPMGRAVARWGQRKRAAAWDGWRGQAHLWRRAINALGAMRGSTRRRCLNSWKATSGERQRLRGNLRRGLARCAQLAAWRGLNAWIEMARTRRGFFELLAAGTGAFAQRKQRAAINMWLDRAFDEPAIMEWAVASWVGGALTKGWRIWVQQTLERHMRVASLHSKALSFLRHYPLAKRWHDWRQHVHDNLTWRNRWRELTRAAAPLRKLVYARLVRAAMARWADGAWEYGVAASRRSLLREWRQQAVASCSRNGVLRLLRPGQRREWPKVWSDFFGWQMTWREVPWWLASIGILVPHSQAVLVSTLRAGHVYMELIDRITAAPHQCVDESCAHTGKAGPFFWAAAAAELGERGWGGVVSDFLRSKHATCVLGEKLCKELEDVCRPPRQPIDASATAHAAAAVEDGGRAVEHLALLRAFRVIVEIDQPELWARFIGSLTGPNPSDARTPRFTARHPADDYSRCEPLAPGGANFVCLGCATPRILLHNQKCGECETHATVSTEEYLATFANGLEQVREREELQRDHASRQLAQSKLQKLQQMQLFDKSRSSPLTPTSRPSPLGSAAGSPQMRVFGSPVRLSPSGGSWSGGGSARMLSPNGLPRAERPSSAGVFDGRSRVLYNGYDVSKVRSPARASPMASPLARGKKLSMFSREYF